MEPRNPTSFEALMEDPDWRIHENKFKPGECWLHEVGQYCGVDCDVEDARARTEVWPVFRAKIHGQVN